MSKMGLKCGTCQLHWDECTCKEDWKDEMLIKIVENLKEIKQILVIISNELILWKKTK